MRSIRVVLAAVFLAAVSNATRFNVIAEGGLKFRVVSEHQQALRGFADPNVIVEAEYNETMAVTGWDTMKIVTSSAFSDLQQATAAGYFEGSQTADKAYNHYFNTFPTPDTYPQVAVDFIVNATQWMDQQIKTLSAAGPLDIYWTNVNLIWAQWNGMYQGMQSATSGNKLSYNQLLTLTSTGDLFDIIPALIPQSRPNTKKMNRKQFEQFFAMNTHCTSLFKVTEDLQDIFFGHVSWNRYVTMMRIFKQITLNFNNASAASKTISMSSYPGFVSSFDDFYVMDSGLNVIETSLSVFNLNMYKGNVRPDLLLYWVRVMVANRVANSAPAWAAVVTPLNSGTYNNQWMILDLKKFTPGQPLPDDTMWIAEQMPGIVASQDVTPMLRFGYYPSYNIPMNETLYNLGGYPQYVEQYGPNMASYELCVRARIFRRDQGKVTDLESYKHMMQYNDFEEDPISGGNPLYAISSRVDLDPHQPQCFGAIDAKVSSYKLWKQGQVVHAYSGPTPQQPVFGFNTTWSSCTQHKGINEMYQYGWQVMQP